MERWFLSYNSQDTLHGQVRAKLRDLPGTALFYAPESLSAGGYWLPTLADEIHKVDAFILLIGEKGLGPWQVLEYYEALDRRVKQPTFPILVLLLKGQPAPALPFLRQLHWIVEPDLTAEVVIGKIRDAVAGQGSRPARLWGYTAPYRGLHAMTEADSDFFFGRTNETVATLRAMADHPGCLPLLIGNSGVGKSSLAQAGVLAALKRQTFPEGAQEPGSWPVRFRNSRQWVYLTLKPGTDPIRALVETFLSTWQLDATDPNWDARRERWLEEILAGKATLQGLLNATERRLHEIGQSKPPAFLLYVDQGEELYARSEKHQGRRFSELIALGLADPRFFALMSMRADFLGALQNDGALFKAREQIDVPPLHEAELLEVVSRPAALLGARFEPTHLARDLAQLTAEESVKDSGALPLLSYLLDDMWTQMIRRGDGVLRLETPAIELGGVLAKRADDFLELYPEARDRLRRILTLKLATVREDGDPTRRRAGRSEFSEEEWHLVCELANEPYRLLVTVTPDGRESFAEVAHEAIFRRWKTLRDWIAAERDFLVWKAELEADRRKWESTSDDAKNDALLMGLGLVQGKNWQDLRAEDLSPRDREFIGLSIKRETEEREAQQVKEIAAANERAEAAQRLAEEQARRARAIKWASGIGISLTLFALIAVGAFAFQQAQSLAYLRQSEASSIWSRLEFTAEDLRSHELDEVWKLATADLSVFEAFWTQVPGNPSLIRKLGLRPELLMRTIGLGTGSSQRAHAAIESLLQALQISTAPEQRIALARAFGALPVTLSPEKARAVMEPLLQTFQTSTSPGERHLLAEVLGALTAKLPPEQASAAIQPLLHAFQTSTDPGERRTLVDALEAFAPRLPAEQARIAMSLLLQAFQTSTEPGERYMLAQVLGTLAGKLPPEQGRAAIEPLLKALQASTEVGERFTLAQAFGAMPVELTPDQARAALEPLLHAFQTSTDFGERRTLVDALEALAPKLPAEQARIAMEPLLQALETSMDSGERYPLIKVLQAFAPKLPAEQARAAMEPLLLAFQTSTESGERRTLVHALEALAPRLPAEHARTAMEPLLQAFQTSTSSGERYPLARALGALAPKLPPEQARAAMEPLLHAFQTSTDFGERRTLVDALEALAPKLPAEQARAAMGLLLQAFQTSTEPEQRIALAQALGALPVELTREQAREAIESLLHAFQTSTDSGERYPVAEVLEALAPKLPAEQTRAALSLLLQAFQTSTEPEQRIAMTRALQGLTPKLNPEEAATVLSLARTKLTTSANDDEARQWGKVIVNALQQRPQDEHIAETIEVLKYPNAAREGTTEVLLSGLRNRLPDAPSGGLQGTIAWIEEHFRLDQSKLSSPPIRPDAPAGHERLNDDPNPRSLTTWFRTLWQHFSF